jgi:DNA invertase Pin-like site-specific DNA recombinase
VWRLDRLGRTIKGLLTLLEELQILGVGVVSLREGFDLSTPCRSVDGRGLGFGRCV